MVEVVKQTEASPLISVPKPRIGAEVYSTKPCDSEIHGLGGDVIFKGNLNKSDLAKFIHISDALTSEILKTWSEISYNGNISSTEHLLSLPLWQNSLMRIRE